MHPQITHSYDSFCMFWTSVQACWLSHKLRQKFTYRWSLWESCALIEAKTITIYDHLVILIQKQKLSLIKISLISLVQYYHESSSSARSHCGLIKFVLVLVKFFFSHVIRQTLPKLSDWFEAFRLIISQHKQVPRFSELMDSCVHMYKGEEKCSKEMR